MIAVLGRPVYGSLGLQRPGGAHDERNSLRPRGERIATKAVILIRTSCVRNNRDHVLLIDVVKQSEGAIATPWLLSLITPEAILSATRPQDLDNSDSALATSTIAALAAPVLVPSPTSLWTTSTPHSFRECRSSGKHCDKFVSLPVSLRIRSTSTRADTLNSQPMELAAYSTRSCLI